MIISSFPSVSLFVFPEIVPRLVEATRRGAEQTRCNKVALLRIRKEQSLRWIAAKPKQQYCVLQ